jgi:hypothetical protein
MLDLAAIARRVKPTRRSKEIVMRPVVLPAMLASDLFAVGYDPILKAWLDLIPTIVAQYERSLASITSDSPVEIGETMAQGESAAARILLSIRLRLSEWAMRVERLHRGKWGATVAAATGVNLSTMIGPEGARVPVSMAIERNVGRRAQPNRASCLRWPAKAAARARDCEGDPGGGRHDAPPGFEHCQRSDGEARLGFERRAPA